MATKLFVGSLAFETDDKKLKDFFSDIGEVISATVITDKLSGKSRGFGFVEMSDQDAKEAIRELNNKKLDERTVLVKEARPKEERPQRNSFGGGFDRDSRKNNHRRRY